MCDGPNLYAYVGNGVMMHVDIHGAYAQIALGKVLASTAAGTVAGAIGGAAVGGITGIFIDDSGFLKGAAEGFVSGAVGGATTGFFSGFEAPPQVAGLMGGMSSAAVGSLMSGDNYGDSAFKTKVIVGGGLGYLASYAGVALAGRITEKQAELLLELGVGVAGTTANSAIDAVKNFTDYAKRLFEPKVPLLNYICP